MMSNFSFGQSHASAKHIFHRYLGQYLLRQTTFHLTSEAEAEETLGLTAERFVLPNIIQLRDDFFGEGSQQATKPAAGAPFTLLFLSRIHPKKNLENLLSALATLNADFRFLIAGMAEEQSYLKQLQDFANEKGLGEKVVWLGTVHGARKFEYYSAAHLFVLPSFNENFANVVIEALSCGTPVLISGEVGLSSYVRENKLGWVCNTSVEDIREKLALILGAGEELSTIRQKAPAIIRRDYSPAALARQYVAAYEKYAAVR
jgi:glycosyltransferase involved in cell wall biosynthesis